MEKMEKRSIKGLGLKLALYSYLDWGNWFPCLVSLKFEDLKRKG